MEIKCDHDNLTLGQFCPECGFMSPSGKKDQAAKKETTFLDFFIDLNDTEYVEKFKSESVKVSRQASRLAQWFYILGFLTVITGILISFGTNTSEIPSQDFYTGEISYNEVTTHPYIQFGLTLALSGLLTSLVSGVILRFISLESSYRGFAIVALSPEVGKKKTSS